MNVGESDDILQRARRRDEAALAAIVERYHPRLFGLLYRMTGSRDVAEDLLQETFLRMVRTIERYEPSGRFDAWLLRIAGNLARDWIRRQARRGPSLSLDAPLDDGQVGIADRAVADLESVDSGLDRAERSAALERGLGTLNDHEREVLLLHHHGGLSFREIAALLGVPLGTALARGHRALKKLRAVIGREEIHETG